jgi:hypothetical protein
MSLRSGIADVFKEWEESMRDSLVSRLVIEVLTLVAVALACVGLRRRYTSVPSCAARSLSGFDYSAPAPSKPSAAHFNAISRGSPQPSIDPSTDFSP